MRTNTIPKIILVISILATASLACSLLGIGQKNQAEATSAPAEVVTVESTPATDQSAPTVDNQAATGSDESGAKDISGVSGDLSGLTSYSLVFSMTYQGLNEQGEEKSGSLEILEEFNKTQNASHMRYTSSGDTSDENSGISSFEIYTLDNVQYMIGLDGTESSCASMSSEETGTDYMTSMNPDDWFGGIDQAKLVARGEEVNGVKTDHYQFDQSNIAFSSYTSASGDIWVAQDGGYTVKMTATATGDTTFLTEANEGQITWDYSLSQVNQDFQITLPESCAGQEPATDIPIPDTATGKSMFSGMTTFSTTDDVTTTANFYRSELPNQGWTITSDEDLSWMINMAATKDSRTINIMISSDGTTTSVFITEGE